jgi:hypothetical protein
MKTGIFAKRWFEIVGIEVAAAAGAVDAVLEEFYLKETKSGATVLQNVGVAPSDEASNFRMRKRKRYRDITRQCLKPQMAIFVYTRLTVFFLR